VTAATLTPAELDHGTPCATCRWYVILIRRLIADAHNARFRAQANCALIPDFRASVRTLVGLNTRYRLHRKACRTEGVGT
jgi:hypothetical protein